MATRDDANPTLDTGKTLPIGSRHYRAFVGPPARYDLVGALQFSLLTALGLREQHFLLDIGCGSLRAGRLFIPYLLPGRYFGIEPEAWLLDEGIKHELGDDVIAIKRPTFSTTPRFDLSAFEQEFDFLLAQSIFSHASPAQIQRCLSEARRVMHSESLFAATFVPGTDDYRGEDWLYPGCVTYNSGYMAATARQAGLESLEIDWPHPSQRWILFHPPDRQSNLPDLPTAAKIKTLQDELRACLKHYQKLSSHPYVRLGFVLRRVLRRDGGSSSRPTPAPPPVEKGSPPAQTTARPRRFVHRHAERFQRSYEPSFFASGWLTERHTVPLSMNADPQLPTLDSVELDGYDFLDFGSGIGGSLVHCEKEFGASRGLGIDVDPDKVRKAQSLGREVVLGDILSLPASVSVRFVSMMDFLEHLPNFKAVEAMLAVARRAACEFIFIRHPSFEDEAYLNSLGLKQYWTDWTGHKAHILISDFSEMFHRIGLSAWNVTFRDPVVSSDDASILPLSAPPNLHGYDSAICGPKKSVSFAKSVHRQLDIVVWIPTDPEVSS